MITYHNKLPMLVGLTGYAQAGKDTAAQELITKHGYVRVALADNVRNALYALNPHVKIADNDIKTIVDTIGWEAAKQISEVRALLQRIGTEAGRNIHGETLWTDLATKQIKQYLDKDIPVVVTDIRFPNESAWLKENNGYVVRVVRESKAALDATTSAHASERNDLIDVDAQIDNDGTIEQLRNRLIDAIKKPQTQYYCGPGPLPYSSLKGNTQG